MLASYEVRWFLNGPLASHPLLRDWVENCAPVGKAAAVGPPAWKGRLQDEPDIYLIVPDQDDMGIKWRERQFQVKGRVSEMGTQLFSGRHCGRVESWMKWSYQGEAVERAFGAWFAPDARAVRVEVSKTRCLRKVRMDPLAGELQEVDARSSVDRGGSLEVTELAVGRACFCSVAFEAFPDDSEMQTSFNHFVACFLQELQAVELRESESMGYPAWLRRTFLPDLAAK